MLYVSIPWRVCVFVLKRVGEDERLLPAADTAMSWQRKRSTRAPDTRRPLRHLLSTVPRSQPSM